MNSSRFLFAIFLLTLFFRCTTMVAVPAYPYKVTVRTITGKDVDIFLRGDEYKKYAMTTDGYTLLSDSQGWWYAERADDGMVIKSSFMLMSAEEETIELKTFKQHCAKGIVPERNLVSETFKVAGSRQVTNNSHITGERRALVILMQYPDFMFRKTKEEFDALFNTLDYKDNGANGSVRDFYRYASQGQLDYISDVYGPYTSTYPMNYYGANSSSGGSDIHAIDLCIEAVRSLPKDIDYSLYDNDGDGLVDNVHIIFAGYGEEAGANANAIWAHEYPHSIPLKSEIGYSLAGYSCTPELRGNQGSEISYIGVICHELGHTLGAMDYYDTNYSIGGEYFGTGKWDIMANGSWNDDGRTPSNFNPYVRSEVFGWSQQISLVLNQHVTMPQIDVDNAEDIVVYRIDTESDGDYFLVENRQQYMFDSAIPGSGLMIYHIHPDINAYNATNTINATHPQGLYPVCASYSEPNKKNYGNINSAECPFPGSKDITTFSPVAWDGGAAKTSIIRITQHTADGSITFTTGQDNIDKSDTINQPLEQALVYKESFETNITEAFTIKSVIGAEVWRTYKKGNFVMNTDLIPDATDGENILMLYSGKNSFFIESETISPEINVNTNGDYLFSFDIYCTSPIDYLPRFELYIEDGYGEYNLYTLNETTNQWKHVVIPLTFIDTTFRYKLHGTIYAGGIFIDDIRLSKEFISSMKSTDYDPGNDNIKVYRLDGTIVNVGMNELNTLDSGMYLIKRGDKMKKFILR